MLLIGATVTAGFCFGLWLHWFTNRAAPGKPKSVAQLVRELRKQESLWDRTQALGWSILPSWARHYLRWIEPIPASKVRLGAAEELTENPTAALQALPAIGAALHDSDFEVAARAIEAIENLGPKAQPVLPDLIKLFKDPLRSAARGVSLRSLTAMALARVAPEDPVVHELLRAALKEQSGGASADTAHAAVQALAFLATDANQVVPNLLAALERSHPNLQWEIMMTLGRLGRRTDLVVPAFIRRLQTTEGMLRHATVDALGELGPAAAPAVPSLLLLVEELGHPAPDSRPPLPGRELNEIRISPQFSRSFGMPPPSSEEMHSIIVSLGRIGPAASEAVPFLVSEYQDPASPSRYAAALARWRIDHSTDLVLPVLREGLRRSPPPGRILILGYLTEVGERALADLTESLNDDHADVRVAALRSIAKAKSSVLLEKPVLLRGLKDSDRRVRFTMVRCLAELGSGARPAVPLLEPLLEDPKFLVRYEAESALKKIQPEDAHRWKVKLPSNWSHSERPQDPIFRQKMKASQ